MTDNERPAPPPQESTSVMIEGVRRGTGLRPDDPTGDAKDWIYDQVEVLRKVGIRRPRVTRQPKSADTTPLMPPIWDQLFIGSCTAFAVLRALWHLEKALGRQPILRSFLAHYYWTRVRSGDSPNEDTGATMRSAADTARAMGLAPAMLWPYNPRNFRISPPVEARDAAEKWQVLAHFAVPIEDGLVAIKQSLSERHPSGNGSRGYPVIIGVPVFRDAWDAIDQYGKIPYPKDNDVIDGYHAITLDSFSDWPSRYKWIGFDNSWSERWGRQGQARFPQEYIRDFGFDAWTFRQIEAGIE